MSPQVGAVSKSPVTMLAGERLLSCVGSHVSLQQPRPGERLVAHRASAGQRVRADVHLKSTDTLVGFIAKFTFVLFFDMAHAVVLAMFGQT